jgi:hypothetical protein
LRFLSDKETTALNISFIGSQSFFSQITTVTIVANAALEDPDHAETRRLEKLLGISKKRKKHRAAGKLFDYSEMFAGDEDMVDLIQFCDSSGKDRAASHRIGKSADSDDENGGEEGGLLLFRSGDDGEDFSNGVGSREGNHEVSGDEMAVDHDHGDDGRGSGSDVDGSQPDKHFGESQNILHV